MVDSTKLKKNIIIYTTTLFIFEIIIMQFVYNSKDFFKTPLSFYAIGDYGFIISSGLTLISINYLLLFKNFISISESNVRLKTGSYLLLLTGISLFFVSVFHTNIGSEITLRGKIHVIAAHTHFIILPVAAIFISTGLKRTFNKTYKKITLVFSSFCITVGIALGFDEILFIDSVSGMIQKILIIVILLWIIYSACIVAKVNSKTELVNIS